MEELEALAEEEEQDDSSSTSSAYLLQSRSYAFIAASSIIAAAYTNRSLTGTVREGNLTAEKPEKITMAVAASKQKQQHANIEFCHLLPDVMECANI